MHDTSRGLLRALLVAGIGPALRMGAGSPGRRASEKYRRWPASSRRWGSRGTTVASPLTFLGTAGETKTFTVATLDDAVLESTETFNVSLDAVNALVPLPFT